MTDLARPTNQSHAEQQTLLPFYVNGSLTGAELATMQEHVRSCITCSRELWLEKRTLEAFSSASIIEQSAQASLQRVLQRINTEATPNPPQRLSPVASHSRPRAWFGRLSHPRIMRAAGLALVLALLVVTVTPRMLKSTLTDSVPALYRTLARTDSAPASGIYDIHVVVRSGVETNRLQTVLAAVAGEIVAGPNSVGAITVRVRRLGQPGHDLSTALAQLRRQPEVVFAELAHPRKGPNERSP